MSNRRAAALLASLFVIASGGPPLLGQGFEGRIFFPTTETVCLFEFNGFADIFDGTPLANGTVVPDLSGNSLDATVEANGTDLVLSPGDPIFETAPGGNRELRRAGNANGAARLAINDDQDLFEMAPGDDFSMELYINREVTSDPVKWGILAGTWHSRNTPDDTLDPNLQGAWYGYGLIRSDEGATPGQWSFVLNPLEGGPDSPPRIGCCVEHHAFFDIPEGRHYVVLSVNRVDQTAITYVDGVERGRQTLAPEWSFTTPTDYEHARFTMFAGEDDPSRGSYRAAPAGANLDALRVQRKALTADEVLEIWDNIQAGVPSPPPPDAIQAFVSASKTNVITGQCVKLDASSSNPGVGKTITKHEWKVAGGAFEEGSATREVSFDAPSAAGHAVTLRITNNAAETSEATVRIKVQSPEFRAMIAATLEGRALSGSEIYVPVGSVLTLDGTASRFVIPADALRCPLADALAVEPPTVTEYAWDLDNRPATIEETRPVFDTAPFNTLGDFRYNLQAKAADGSRSLRALITIHVADSEGNRRVFHSTPDTVAHFEFNEFPEIADGSPIPSGAVVQDLSGNGLHATVEANDAGDLVMGPGVGSLDNPAGLNREVRRSAVAGFQSRLGINEDQDLFEMAPEDDFAVELFVNRETTDDPIKWGILAGTWHSRNTPDDTVDSNAQGAWYGYGLIRADETVVGAQWSWVLSPLEGGPDSPPRLGCCFENHAFFNIPLGRHYVVLSVNRASQTAATYVDGNLVGNQVLQPTWSFTTPVGYEHARFTLFAGEDDPSRNAYRPAPAGTHLDAVRVQRRALAAEDVQENWRNIGSGKGANPEFAPARPPAPAGLVATAADGQVTLDWNDTVQGGLEGYVLFRSDAGGPAVRQNASLLTASGYQDTGLQNGTEYCYQVLAVTAAGASPRSAAVCARPPGGVVGPRFVRGDADSNGKIEITDPLRLLGFLFLGQFLQGTDPPTIECLDAADTDNDGRTDISDAIGNLTFQFLGGGAPAQPHPNCGVDPDPDESPSLGCVQPPADCR